MPRTIQLPTVSIGGYGALLKTLSDAALAQRRHEQSEQIESQLRELAAALERRDLQEAEWFRRAEVEA